MNERPKKRTKKMFARILARILEVAPYLEYLVKQHVQEMDGED